MSLNSDTSSFVRNTVDGQLAAAGVTRKPNTTGTWEASGLGPTSLERVADVLRTLAGVPGTVQGADPGVSVDHVWLYMDRD